jgi:WD40 repeat protein
VLYEVGGDHPNHEPATSRVLLDQCDPGLRGWEWHYLRRRLEGSAVTVRLRPGEIVATTFAPDDQTVVTLTSDARLVKRRLTTGDVTGELKLAGEDGQTVERIINRAKFATSGHRIVADAEIRNDRTRQRRNVIAVWDAATGRLVREWPAANGTPLEFAFRSDGERIAVSSGNWIPEHGQYEWRGGAIEVLDVQNGQVCCNVQAAENELSYRGLAFAANSQHLAVSRPNCPLTFLNTNDGKWLDQSGGSAPEGGSICVHPRGGLLGICCDNVLHLCNGNGQSLGQLKGHVGKITAAEFSDDGATIITASTDHTVRVWNVATRQTIALLSGHSLPVAIAALSHSGKAAVSFGADGDLKSWDLAAESTPCFDASEAREGIACIASDSDGKWVVSGGGDGQVMIWDMTIGRQLKSYRVPVGITCLALSSDGKQLALGADGKQELLVIDPMTGEVKQRLHPSEAVIGLSFSPDSRLLLVMGADGMAETWDVGSGAIRAKGPEHSGSVTAGAFNSHGDLVATGGSDGVIRFWDPRTGAIRQTLTAHPGPISCLAFSPNDATIASGSQNRGRADLPATIRIWDVGTGDLKKELKGHDQSTRCLAFLQDGARLASGGQDKSIRIWDVEQGQSLLTLNARAGDVRSLAVCLGGRVLVSCHDDRFLRIWDATPVSEGPGIRASLMQKQQ